MAQGTGTHPGSHSWDEMEAGHELWQHCLLPRKTERGKGGREREGEEGMPASLSLVLPPGTISETP